MRAVVKKWGNGASVRIPASIMAAAGWSLRQAVEIREENGRIVIEPIKRNEYDLVELLAGVSPESMYAEDDFGAPVGKEIL